MSAAAALDIPPPAARGSRPARAPIRRIPDATILPCLLLAMAVRDVDPHLAEVLLRCCKFESLAKTEGL